MMLTICELCSAKKYVVVPNVIYYYRVRAGSVTTENIDDATRVHKWLKVIQLGVAYLDDFLSNREFFRNRSDLKYVLFNVFVNEMLMHLSKIYTQIPAHKLDELLRKEFVGGDDLALMTFIFNTFNVQRLQLMQAQQQFQKFNQFAAQAQARIAQLEAEVKRLQT